MSYAARPRCRPRTGQELGMPGPGCTSALGPAAPAPQVAGTARRYHLLPIAPCKGLECCKPWQCLIPEGEMSKALEWMAAQIMGRQMPTPCRRQVYNPKPKGHPIQGSGSYAIRELLKATPGRWYTLEELRAELSLTRDQAEWGVRYLRMTGAIESRLDERDRLRPIGRYRCT